MRYISTRGDAPILGFDDVVLAGLASDGGLYVPDGWPEPIVVPDPSEGYAATAAAVLAPFMTDSILFDDLASITSMVYSAFDHPDVAPLVPISDDHLLLELFWGQTLSFKDYAISLVAVFFDRILTDRGRRALVLGATSGDTGAAAMAALAGMPSVDVIVLFPEGRISEVQRRQMTTLEAGNLHAVAVRGTFDDCQDLVKQAFADERRDRWGLAAVNSINWARIACQTAYHMWAASHADREVTMAVPTGNFGNALSADVARRLGAPIRRIVVANNANRGMAALVDEGRMKIDPVEATLAPAMDIAVPSNLERYLFDLSGRDPNKVRAALQLFRGEGLLVLDEIGHAMMRSSLRSGYLDDEGILEVMSSVWNESGRAIDPHTATAWRAGQEHQADGTTLVTVSTAHPAKFADVVESATGLAPEVPERLAGLLGLPERVKTIDARLEPLLQLVDTIG